MIIMFILKEMCGCCVDPIGESGVSVAVGVPGLR